MSIEAVTDVAYYPRLWELGAMVVYAAAIVWLGWLVRSHWTRAGEVPPIPVALLLWAGMFALYAAMPFTFYLVLAPPPPPDRDLYDPDLLAAYAPVADRRITVLYWCLLVWTIPVAYATTIVVNSLATRSVDRIGPFSAHIDDPSEFAAARKLALRGDINGAVAMYRSYTDDQANALFEAARLLRSVDRFAEAASLFDEIASRFYGKVKVWAEAVYQLGKLQETQLSLPDMAQENYKRLLDRAPDGRFGQLAMADLARMQVLGQDFLLDDTDEPETAPVSKSELIAAARRARTEMSAPRANDDPVPGKDPFFELRQAAAAAVDAKAASDGKAAKAKAKAAAKPKAAPAKKAAPKPSAAAAKKAAATPKKPTTRKKKA